MATKLVSFNARTGIAVFCDEVSGRQTRISNMSATHLEKFLKKLAHQEERLKRAGKRGASVFSFNATLEDGQIR